MVGSTRPGAWLTSSSSARGGGSSSTLSSAFSPALLRSSSGSTIATRQPPSPGGRAEERHGAPDILDAGHREQLAGLLVDDALEHQEVAVRLPGDAPRGRMVGRNGERFGLLHGGHRRIGIGQHEARHAIGERRLADAASRRRSARRAGCGRRGRRRAASARPRHGRTARCVMRGRGIAPSSLSARRCSNALRPRTAIGAAAGSSFFCTTRQICSATSSFERGGIDQHAAIRLVGRERQKAVAQPFMKRQRLALEPVGAARRRGACRHGACLPWPAHRG